MRPGSGQGKSQDIVLDEVDQKPIRFDGAFPEALEVSLKSMVLEICRQRLTFSERVYDIEKERGVIAAFLDEFEILLELGVFFTLYISPRGLSLVPQGQCTPLRSGRAKRFWPRSWQARSLY